MDEVFKLQATETRAIEGSIAADGRILDGTGFIVNHLGVGSYEVIFDEAFYYNPPQFTKFEVLDGDPENPYGFKAELNGKVTKKGFKYFTFELFPTDLVMKDLEIEFFHLWGLKKPVQNADCVDGIKIKAANPFIDPFYGL